MSLFLRGLLWLSVLGGAAAGIGLPTKNAVQSILNKQEIRRSGWNTESGKNYENYWYGINGFGDSRTNKVTNGQWQQKIKTALEGVRGQWGKKRLGEGLEKKFESWLSSKSLCKGTVATVSTNNDECSVGNIEFIEEKDKSLFGRIPLADKDGKKVNVYIKWYKCKQNPKNASGIWFGGSRKEGENSISKNASKGPQKYNWCLESSQKK